MEAGPAVGTAEAARLLMVVAVDLVAVRAPSLGGRRMVVEAMAAAEAAVEAVEEDKVSAGGKRS